MRELTTTELELARAEFRELVEQKWPTAGPITRKECFLIIIDTMIEEMVEKGLVEKVFEG